MPRCAAAAMQPAQASTMRALAPSLPACPQVYALEAPEGEAGGGAAAPQPHLVLSAGARLATVTLGYWEQLATVPGGLARIGGEGGRAGGGPLGRGGLDRLLQVAEGKQPLLAGGAGGAAAAGGAADAPDFHLVFELPGLELSVVDGTPQARSINKWRSRAEGAFLRGSLLLTAA